MMNDEIMTVREVAEYLKMNARTIYKLAREGKIPAVKFASQWRFKRSVINDWLELEMRKFSSKRLVEIEKAQGTGDLKIVDLMKRELISVNLQATSKDEVLGELVEIANRSGHLRSKRILLSALEEREKLCSTATEEGVALPHPRFTPSGLVDRPLVVFGRSKRGIEFGGEKPTHFFFLVCAPDERIHLRLLAKISRLLRKKTLLSALMNADSPDEVIWRIKTFEGVLD